MKQWTIVIGREVSKTSIQKGKKAKARLGRVTRFFFLLCISFWGTTSSADGLKSLLDNASRLAFGEATLVVEAPRSNSEVFVDGARIATVDGNKMASFSIAVGRHEIVISYVVLDKSSQNYLKLSEFRQFVSVADGQSFVLAPEAPDFSVKETPESRIRGRILQAADSLKDEAIGDRNRLALSMLGQSVFYQIFGNVKFGQLWICPRETEAFVEQERLDSKEHLLEIRERMRSDFHDKVDKIGKLLTANLKALNQEAGAIGRNSFLGLSQYEIGAHVRSIDMYLDNPRDSKLGFLESHQAQRTSLLNGFLGFGRSWGDAERNCRPAIEAMRKINSVMRPYR